MPSDESAPAMTWDRLRGGYDVVLSIWLAFGGLSCAMNLRGSADRMARAPLFPRRLVVRWERIAACFEAFLAMATIHIWIHRLIVG